MTQFLFGILLFDQLRISAAWYVYVAPLLILTTLLIWNRMRSPRMKRTYQQHAGALHMLLLCTIGFCMANHYQNKYSAYASEWNKEAVPYLQAEVTETPLPTAKSIKANCLIRKPKSNLQTQAILYFKKNDSIPTPQKGDILLLSNSLRPFDSPKNPGEFNYKRYLRWKRIHFQQFVQPNDYRIIDHRKASHIEQLVEQSRQYVKHVLHTVIQSDREQKVAHALFLGDKHLLDPEIKSAYAETGAMHVLAVSGLHVGIFYMMLQWMLTTIIQSKQLRLIILRNVIILLFIWFYAFLTGSSPSVMRAATMFSFIIVADTSRSKSNIFNTLSASAFILLLFKPFMLFEVGFQLSYLAVFGIVLFFPIFYQLVHIQYNWLDKIWQITCVSFAAQLATFPLGLLYFNQFPLIFPLSNLFVIPLIGIIIHLGIATISLAWVPNLFEWLGYLLNKSIQLLNLGVFRFEKIPNTLLENIHVSPFKTIMIYGFILSLLGLYHVPRTKPLLISLLLLFGLSSHGLLNQLVQAQNSYVVVFYENRSSTIGFSDSDHAMVTSSQPFNDSKKYNIKTFFVAQHQSPIYTTFDSIDHFRNHFLTFNNQSILRIDQDFKMVESKPLQTDVLILSESQPYAIAQIHASIQYNYLVFDSSNSYWKLKQWISECDSLQLVYHDVNEAGAFVLKF